MAQSAADFLDDNSGSVIAPVNAADFLDNPESAEDNSAANGNQAAPNGIGASAPNPANQQGTQGQSTFPQQMYNRFADQPGTYYSGMLPIAGQVDAQGNHIPGTNTFAFPEMIRSPMRGLAEMMAGTHGDIPAGTPESPDMIGSMLALSPTVPTNGGVSAFANGVNAAGKITGNVLGLLASSTDTGAAEDQMINSLFSPTQRNYPTTQAGMKNLASQHYTAAEQLGGTYSPDFTDRVLQTIAGPDPSTPAEVAAAASDPLKQFAAKYQGMAGQPMSLSDAQLLDEKLGDLAKTVSPPGIVTKDSANILDAQSKLRNMVLNPDPADVQGGPQGAQALAAARATWSQAMKMRDMEAIQQAADYSQNPATTIQNGLKQIILNPKRNVGYSPDELATMKSVAKSGTGLGARVVTGAGRALPLVGTIAGADHGVFGALLGSGLGTAGSALTKIGTGKIAKSGLSSIVDTIGQNAPPPPIPFQLSPSMAQ